MKYLNVHTIEKTVTIFTVTLVAVGVGILFYFLSLRLGDVARENQTYDRYISCVLSVTPEARDQAKIDQCWNRVQKDTGIEVKRYDTEEIE